MPGLIVVMFGPDPDDDGCPCGGLVCGNALQEIAQMFAPPGDVVEAQVVEPPTNIIPLFGREN